MQVYEATFHCAPCAVKRVPRERISTEAVDGMMSEIRMMSRLHHPNIIQFLACVFEPYVCLVLELAAKGSLRNLVDPNKSKFKFKWEEGGAEMVSGIARGMHYLVCGDCATHLHPPSPS